MKARRGRPEGRRYGFASFPGGLGDQIQVAGASLWDVGRLGTYRKDCFPCWRRLHGRFPRCDAPLLLLLLRECFSSIEQVIVLLESAQGTKPKSGEGMPTLTENHPRVLALILRRRRRNSESLDNSLSGRDLRELRERADPGLKSMDWGRNREIVPSYGDTSCFPW
jgi:hypothetical protein